MQPRDKISKSSWTLHESSKDTVATNLVNAIRSGQLKIEAASVERLLAVVAASADEGYHKGHKVFLRTIDSAVTEAVRDAELVATMPVPDPKKQATAKKK